MCFVQILNQLLKSRFTGRSHLHLCSNCDFKILINKRFTTYNFLQNINVVVTSYYNEKYSVASFFPSQKWESGRSLLIGFCMDLSLSATRAITMINPNTKTLCLTLEERGTTFSAMSKNKTLCSVMSKA